MEVADDQACRHRVNENTEAEGDGVVGEVNGEHLIPAFLVPGELEFGGLLAGF